MKYLIVYLALLSFQDLPYKPKEEFEVRLDYKFKQRPAQDHTVVNMNETREEYNRRTSTDLLPYLVLHVKFIRLNDEARVRITNNLDTRPVLRKVEEGDVLPIDVGFTADVKDRILPHEYVLTFTSKDKSDKSRIVIHVDEDGTFLVNAEKRGRF